MVHKPVHLECGLVEHETVFTIVGYVDELVPAHLGLFLGIALTGLVLYPLVKTLEQGFELIAVGEGLIELLVGC